MTEYRLRQYPLSFNIFLLGSRSYVKDTIAVTHPMADPNANAPKKTPKKFPIDFKTAIPSKGLLDWVILL